MNNRQKRGGPQIGTERLAEYRTCGIFETGEHFRSPCGQHQDEHRELQTVHEVFGRSELTFASGFG
jgi:hypothetical protein